MWPRWIVAIVFAVIGSAIACGGEGPTEPPVFDVGRSSLSFPVGPYIAGQSYAATFTARDADGDPYTPSLTVALGLSGGTSSGTFAPVSSNGQGVYSTSFTATTAGSPSQLSVTVNGAVFPATPLLLVLVLPGPASTTLSGTAAAPTSIAVGASSTITVTVRDAVGNTRTAGGDVVTLAKGSGTSDGTLSAVTDNANGTYTATFTGTVAGSARQVNASLGGAPILSVQPALTVTPPPPSLALSTVAVGASTLASGSSTTVTLTLRDAAGAALPTAGLTVLFTKGTGNGDGTFSTTTDNGNGTYSATFTATTAGSARTIGATIGGSVVTSTPPAITVTPGPVSLGTSTLTVGTPTLASSASTSLTLTTRDAAGNARTSGGLTVVFNKGAGTSDGTISATTDNGNGTYSASFTATTAGSARTIGATIGGAAVTSTLPTITVGAGGLSLAQSSVTVGASAVASGASTSLTLTARDAAGNAIAAGGATVLFTKGSGTSDGTISAVTDVGNGTYAATFTATTAGTARAIGATVGGAAVTSGAPTITVTPGAASTVTSAITATPGALLVGQQSSLRLTTRDASGNALTTGGLVVAFTKGTGTADGTISAVSDVGDGSYTASFTATTAGTARSIGATIGGVAVTSAAPTVLVTDVPPSLSLSTVTVGSASIVSGTGTGVTLTVRDASGTAFTTGGLAVTFVPGSGTSSGTLASVIDNGNGTYSATFTGTTAGSARAIGATIGGATVTSAAPTITVTPGAASVAQSTLTVGSGTLASGTGTALTLVTRDAAGNTITTGGLVVAFTRGAGTSDGTISAVTDAGNGRYTATLTATTAGSARTIGATIGGAALTSALPTITVTPGPLSLATSAVALSSPTVASGGTVTATLTARDAAGNTLGAGGRTVLFTLGTGTSAGSFGAVTDVGNGTYTAVFTATAVGTARAVGATIDAAPVTSTAPTITVLPGAVSLAQSTLAAGVATLASGGQTTLTLTTRDAAGNALITGGLTVAFTRGAGTADGTLSAVTDVGNGTYTATFTATAAGSARTFGATIGGAAITSALPTIAVTPGVISLAQSLVTVTETTIASGTATTLTLTARDAAGNALGTGGATVLFTKGNGTSDGTISAVTDNANGLYTATFTATTAGTARAIGATVGGAAITSTAPTITVTPGALSLALSTVTVGSATLVSGASTTLTLTTRDAAGNARTTGGATVLFTKGTGTSDGTIAAVTDVGNGTYTATFTATTSGTARAIGATVGAAAVTAVAPTITVTPGAISTATSTLSAAPDSIALSGVSTITLTAFDAAGNRITTGGATVVFVKLSGFADGPLSATTDLGDGRYRATFTAVQGGAPRVIGATIGGAAVTTTPVTIVVVSPPNMVLGASRVDLTAQLATLSSPQLVAIANLGGGTLTGLSATSQHVPQSFSPALCASVNWLVAPTFDMGGVADPLSLMTLRANVAGLGLGTCVRRVIVTTTTPSVPPDTVLVSVEVGRTPAASGVVNVVMMGNANSNVVQTIRPDPVLQLDNNGRGTISNLTAQIISQSGFAECVDPFDTGTCVPWLAPGDLVFSSPTMPSTLSIVSQVRPFSASAVVRVAGTGMTPRDFNINVAFNVTSELVTNPRNVSQTVSLASTDGLNASVVDSVTAFNQNWANGALTNFRLDPASPPLPSWLKVVRGTTFADSVRFYIRADSVPRAITRDTVITLPSAIRILADCVRPSDCGAFSPGDPQTPKSFVLPYALTVQSGLRLTASDTVRLFLRAGAPPATVDIAIEHRGAGELVELAAQVVSPGSHPWLSAQIVGGATSSPATLRLTASSASGSACTIDQPVVVTGRRVAQGPPIRDTANVRVVCVVVLPP